MQNAPLLAFSDMKQLPFVLFEMLFNTIIERYLIVNSYFITICHMGPFYISFWFLKSGYNFQIYSVYDVNRSISVGGRIYIQKGAKLPVTTVVTQLAYQKVFKDKA